MQKRILMAGFSLLVLLHIGCRKSISKNDPRSTAKTIEASSLLSTSFCSMTDDEKELHFGLERNQDSNFYLFSQDQLNVGMANFYANFKYADSGLIQNLDSSNQTLAVGDLIQLYATLQNDSSVHYDPDSNYSAIQMNFGMEGKKIILIYEPVVLKPTAIAKECTVVSTNRYFRVDSLNNFIEVTYTNYSGLVQRLRNSGSKIHINHPNDPTVSAFINNSDSTGDVRSNIVSFQQIAKMYCDNTSLESFWDRINFTIVANRNAAMTNNYRMHVVPNFRLGLSSTASGTYKNYAADFVQMCPTKCNIVSINYYAY